MHAYEWALRDAMAPPHALLVLGVDGGEAIAMGSGISYGALGVVGNMVVAETYRRRGIGRAILERVLAFLTDERGCDVLELSATSMGRPLYERYGFEPAGSSAMVTISRAAVVGRSDGVKPGGRSDLEDLAAYDSQRFGGDRRAILAAALDDDERPVIVARRDGRAVGYAVLRPIATRLGPWLADDPAAAGALLVAAAQLMPGDPLTTNVRLENEEGVRWFRAIGARLDTWEGGMRRGDPRAVRRRPEAIYGNVVGALG